MFWIQAASPTTVAIFYGTTDGALTSPLGTHWSWRSIWIWRGDSGQSNLNTAYYFTRSRQQQHTGVAWAAPSGAFTTLATNPVFKAGGDA